MSKEKIIPKDSQQRWEEVSELLRKESAFKDNINLLHIAVEDVNKVWVKIQNENSMFNWYTNKELSMIEQKIVKSISELYTLQGIFKFKIEEIEKEKQPYKIGIGENNE